MLKRKIKNSILLFGIPLLLFFVGLGMSFLLNSNSFSTLSYSHSLKSTDNFDTFLKKGEKISTEFIGKEPNLGIIEIKLEKSRDINFQGDDILTFRIKKVGEKDWFYQQQYSVNPFEPVFVLPVGFPVLADSRGTKYFIELESLAGNGANSVKAGSSIHTLYKFSKSQVISSPTLMIEFLSKKVLLSVTNTEFLFSSVIYFLPLLFYFVWLLIRTRFNLAKRIISYSVFFIILIDSLLFVDEHAGIILLLIGMWVLTVIIYRLESSVSFVVSFLFLIIALLLILLGIEKGINKVSIYTYGFLLVGLVQLVVETCFKPKKLISYKKFLK